VLLRGFSVTEAETFEALAGSLVAELYGDYGDLPHDKDAGNVYKSTPYPAELPILFHHESAHMPQWPRRQFFCCVRPSSEGGATPLVDGRKAYAALPESLRRRFETVGLCYVRNFIDGVDVDWSRLFGTTDRAQVEKRCNAQDIECEWQPDGTLRTRQWAPAVIRHPDTGEPVFFHQILLHHAACLEPELRASMRSLFGAEIAFPRSVRYGDGQPIGDADIELVRSGYDSLACRFTWQRGDVLIIDNMLVAHGRDPFAGDREIIVAMGDMATRREVAGTPPEIKSTVVS
jgi:alpha-ketoglutarate-dependent taurine dioxygenase